MLGHKQSGNRFNKRPLTWIGAFAAICTTLAIGLSSVQSQDNKKALDPFSRQDAEQLKQLQAEQDRLSKSLSSVRQKIATLEAKRGQGVFAPIESQFSNYSLTPSLWSKLKTIQGEVDRLRKAGDTNAAFQMATELHKHVRSVSSKGIEVRQESELHVIGVYEGFLENRAFQDKRVGTAVVDVQLTKQPIVLALASCDPVKWQVQLADGAVVQKVVVCGGHAQEIKGLPKSVPVIDAGRFFAYSKSDWRRYTDFTSKLGAKTGLDVATFQGGYRPTRTFVIGPANVSWRHDLLEFRVDSLHETAARYQREQQRIAMQAIRFRAVHAAPSNEPFFRVQASLAAFTPTGPIATTLQPLPQQVFHVAVDPRDSKLYVISGHKVASVNDATGKLQPIELDAGLPEISWPCGITFDTKRRRVVLVTLGGEGFIYGYSPDTSQWSKIASCDNIDMQTISYSSENDVLYAIGCDHRSGGNLLTISPGGAVISRTSLPKSISTDRSHGSATGNQIVAVGKQVVVFSPNRSSDRKSKTVIKSYLINPRSGEVLWSGEARPHAGSRKLEQVDMEKIWAALRDAETNEADRLMWQLAAGGDAAVKFVRTQFKPLPKPDKDRIAKLIVALGDDEFTVRQEAQRELASMDGLAADLLQTAAEKSESIEVRQRIRRLLEQIKNRSGGTPESRRELRAIDVLSRIGTSAAGAALKNLAAESKTATRAIKAQDAVRKHGS